MPTVLNRTVLKARGEREPEGAAYVGRPTVWGNPFVIGRDGTRGEVIAKYREHVVVRKVDRERRRITVLYKNLPLEADFDEVQLPDDFKGDEEGGPAIVGGDVRG